MIKNFLKTIFTKSPIYIYGCGKRGKEFASILKDFDANIICFFDSDVNKIGQKYLGIPVCKWAGEKVDGVIAVSPINSKDVFDFLFNSGNEVYSTEDVDSLKSILSYIDYKKSGYNSLHQLSHFYSPYPDINFCTQYEQLQNDEILDIDLKISNQINLLSEFKNLYSSLPSWGGGLMGGKGYRYYYPNNVFEIDDALIYHCFIRTFKPKKIIEIGSGFSSAVALDTNEYYFDNSIQLSFIEPYPMRLKKLIKLSDNINLNECSLQDADKKIFKTLEKNDILFVDSTHVSKRDSDVNIIFFEILPKLCPGVIIHFHDIFSKFEYPMEWTRRGDTWTEDYLLRAFLMNNNNYEIIFFNSLMANKLEEDYPYPSCHPGGSIWIRKVR